MEKLIEYAFTDQNNVRSHSSINYIGPDGSEKGLGEEEGFRGKFMDSRKRNREKTLKNRIEKKIRLMKNAHWKTECFFKIEGCSDQYPLNLNSQPFSSYLYILALSGSGWREWAHLFILIPTFLI